MKLVLLQFLLGIWQYSRHDAGNTFAAAQEDLGIPIPDSADVSLFATDADAGLSNPETSILSLDFNLGTGDQQDVFADDLFTEIPDSPPSSYADVPYTTAFNVHEPPKGFAPCPNGKKYACCLDVAYYLPYLWDCIWYDFDVLHPSIKDIFCQPENLLCCQDVENDGLKENNQPGNQGFECEPATRSTVIETLPEQPTQFDWTDEILKVLLFKHPLFQIPPPVGAPEGS